jgi:putative lipoprotein
MKKLFRYIPILLATWLIVACQNNDEADFKNKAFIDGKTFTTETIIKGAGSMVKSLTLSTSRPAEKDLNATFKTAPQMVDTYNKAYYNKAVLLPDSCYRVLVGDVKINQGSVKSNAAQFEFSKLGGLDRSTTYVLPVTVECNDIELLQSAKNYYFVFRAGALINVVADVSRNYLQVDWKTPELVTDMKQITMEALIYPREFGKLISTIMGIEGNFLMRIGDAGFPDNQIQIATGVGNFPDYDSNKGLQTKRWQHVAMTYNADTREVKVYVNGILQSQGTLRLRSVTIKGNSADRMFLIGKSYDDARWFEGDMAEVRVWNVVRTQEEIATHFYSVDPKTPGLVGYWKMDDNTSPNIVKDATGNGNDAKANKPLSWHNVSLPEK